MPVNFTRPACDWRARITSFPASCFSTCASATTASGWRQLLSPRTAAWRTSASSLPGTTVSGLVAPATVARNRAASDLCVLPSDSKHRHRSAETVSGAYPAGPLRAAPGSRPARVGRRPALVPPIVMTADRSATFGGARSASVSPSAVWYAVIRMAVVRASSNRPSAAMAANRSTGLGSLVAARARVAMTWSWSSWVPLLRAGSLSRCMAFARSSPDRGGSARNTTTGSSGVMTWPTVLNGVSRNCRLVTASHMLAHPVGSSDAAAATAIVSARYTVTPSPQRAAV